MMSKEKSESVWDKMSDKSEKTKNISSDGKRFFKALEVAKRKKKKESPGFLLNTEGEKIVHTADYAKNYEQQLILTREQKNKLK